MRIIIATGKEAELLNNVIPRSYVPKYKRVFRKRMKWIISLMEKNTITSCSKNN